VDASLEGGEVEPAVPVDHQFAVHDGAPRQLLGERGRDVREVAGEWALLA